MNTNKLGLALGFLSITISSSMGQSSSFSRWADFEDVVAEKLKSKDFTVQLEGIEQFASQDNRDGADYLVKLIQKDREHPTVLKKAGEVLANYESEDAIRVVADATRRSQGKDRYLLAAYIQHGHDDALKVATNVLSSTRDPAVKVAALTAIGNTGAEIPEDQMTVITNYLGKDHFHSARRAAAIALGKLPSSAGVQPLIDHLEDLVLGESARNSLLRLTGQEFWRDSDAWKKWWKENEATFQAKPMDQETYNMKLAKIIEEKGEEAMQVSFYEREITGQNILFLLDASGSMSAASAESGAPRIDKLKQELSHLIGRLDERYSVGMILFPHDTYPSRGIEKIDEKFTKQADRFIERIEANGDTPMGAAVEYAYKKVVPRSNVDTIYLLSDGTPSDTTEAELLNQLLTYNDRYGVTINCVSIGQTSELLQSVATAAGGQYWEIQ